MIIFLLVLLALIFPAKVEAAACDETIGSESLQTFVNGLQSGEAGCLTGTRQGGVTISTPEVTLRSEPGTRATIQGGQVRVAQSANGVTLTKLKLIGGSGVVSPLIYASGVEISNSDITGPEICVHVDVYPPAPIPYGVKIIGNYIHDCGHFPPTNFDHGIYLSDSEGTIIKNNVIVRNADRGVQLYPNANDSRIIGNVIDSNGEGIIFGDYSTGNLVRGNIISRPLLRYGVEAISFPGVTNLVKNNCTWSQNLYGAGVPVGSGIMPPGPSVGFTARDNIVEEPDFSNGYENATCGDQTFNSEPSN
jgi:parallel beta-helix repeat protein